MLVVAVDLVGVGTLALAVATFALGVVALLQLLEARQQRVLTSRSVTLAEQSLALSNQSRIDARGPRVSVLMLRPSFPPLQPQQFVDAEQIEFPLGHTFQLSRDEDLRVIIRTIGFVANDGDSTVTLELPEDQRIDFDVPFEVDGIEPTDQPLYLSDRRYAIRPHTVVALQHFADRPLQFWISAWADDTVCVEFQLTLSDHLASGVTDTFTVQVRTCPFVPVPEHDAQWMIPRSVLDGAKPDRTVVLPGVRQYRGASEA